MFELIQMLVVVVVVVVRLMIGLLHRVPIERERTRVNCSING